MDETCFKSIQTIESFFSDRRCTYLVYEGDDFKQALHKSKTHPRIVNIKKWRVEMWRNGEFVTVVAHPKNATCQDLIFEVK